MPSYFELVEHYPGLSSQQRMYLRDWLRQARYADLIRLLSDPDSKAGLDRAFGDQQQRRRPPEGVALGYCALALRAIIVTVCSVLQ